MVPLHSSHLSRSRSSSTGKGLHYYQETPMKVDGREAGLAGRHTMWVPMIFVEGKDMELVIVEGELLNLNLLDLERLRESEKDFLWTWMIHSVRCSQRAPLVVLIPYTVNLDFATSLYRPRILDA